ncbi:class B sortase [Raoultibacter phocaeensis]|uniref:class B sortase n=1 Tax=Raoultibacter phocaeensis TaxID=2479841 RepID=UPI0021037FC4|nr:class B sortase [Raoultibacter phocaeensis]
MTDNRHNQDASRARHVRSDAGAGMPREARSQQQSSGVPHGGRPRPSGQPRPSVNQRSQQGFAQPAGAPQGSAQTPGARYGRDIVGKKGGKQKKGGPWRVVFWIALVVFIGALIALGVIAFSYWQGQDKYNSVAAAAFEEPADIDAVALSDVVIDWDALRAINPDTVGWVYVPGTMVNYPIVHTDNNDTYLKTDFYGETNWLASYGAIFLAAENTADFSDANNIVYGHHMNDGSMFAQFADFRDEGTFNAHRTVYIFTPEQNYKLTTFSLVVVNANDPLAQPSFADEAEMQAYIQDKIDRSTVAPDSATVAVEDVEKMFAFVTCADYSATNDRIVLFASVADSAVPANAAGAAEGGEGGSIDPEDAAAAEGAAGDVA